MANPGSLSDFLSRAATVFDTHPSLRKNAALLCQIADSCNQPFNLAVVGRMKTGKSTLINSLAGSSLAVTDVEEATATVNWFCFGEGAQLRFFTVYWRDGRVEALPIERIKTDWTGKSEDVMARVRNVARLQLFSDTPKLRQVQIIDTPGTGSAVDAHESAAQDFLSPVIHEQSAVEGGKADAIVYVVGPVGREGDLDNLELFHSARIRSSDPYNSVCVMHKWDSLDVEDPVQEALKKAGRLESQLAGTVAAVIPVSGPIALAARAASDEFFGRLLDLTTTVADESFRRWLKMERRWNEDSLRLQVRECFPNLPWASFVLIARELRAKSVPQGDVSGARVRCLEYSRITHLEDFIQDRFFARAGIIKQNGILEKANQICGPSIRGMEAEAVRLEKDAEQASNAASVLDSLEPDLFVWLTFKRDQWLKEARKIRGAVLDLDREWQDHGNELEGLRQDLQVSEEMQKHPDLFPAEDRKIIQAVCDHLASTRGKRHAGRESHMLCFDLGTLIDVYRAKSNRVSRRFQAIFEHIVRRLEEAYRTQESN
jgi:hypothetical protein